MSQSGKKSQAHRRPPLQNTKPAASGVSMSLAMPDNRVPDGIELTPISAVIIQQVKDLLATRRVDVESLIR